MWVRLSACLCPYVCVNTWLCSALSAVSPPLPLPLPPLQVFFAVLIGAFSIGQAGPSLEELGAAAGAMEFIYKTIHRVGGQAWANVQ